MPTAFTSEIMEQDRKSLPNAKENFFFFPPGSFYETTVEVPQPSFKLIF